MRDYLDLVVLLERLGQSGAETAFRRFDAIYRQLGGASPLSEVSERLAAAVPGDLTEIDLASYRGLVPPWNEWSHVVERGRAWSVVLARIALEAPE